MWPRGTGALEHCLITTQDVASISVSFPLGCFSSHHLKLPDIYTYICLLSVSFTALQSPRGGHFVCSAHCVIPGDEDTAWLMVGSQYILVEWMNV